VDPCPDPATPQARKAAGNDLLRCRHDGGGGGGRWERGRRGSAAGCQSASNI